MGIRGSFPGGEAECGVELSYLYVVTWLRMSGAVPLSPVVHLNGVHRHSVRTKKNFFHVSQLTANTIYLGLFED
jgi:hypothetical protein